MRTSGARTFRTTAATPTAADWLPIMPSIGIAQRLVQIATILVIVGCAVAGGRPTSRIDATSVGGTFGALTRQLLDSIPWRELCAPAPTCTQVLVEPRVYQATVDGIVRRDSLVLFRLSPEDVSDRKGGPGTILTSNLTTERPNQSAITFAIWKDMSRSEDRHRIEAVVRSMENPMGVTFMGWARFQGTQWVLTKVIAISY